MLKLIAISAICLVFVLAEAGRSFCAPTVMPAVVDAGTIKGRIMCGYQGWFRCKGDASGEGWGHWSRQSDKITWKTLTFEMWPEMTEYSPKDTYPAPGFKYPDGQQAKLFTSDSYDVVLRHFEWMKQYGIDGAWMQDFVVALPGGPAASQYRSRINVLKDASRASSKTGRVWALSYDCAAEPLNKTYLALTTNWKAMVDSGLIDSPRYLHEQGRPVVQIWGFYYHDKHDQMTPHLGNKLIDFFKKPGKYSAYIVGGGAWNWRSGTDPQWVDMVHRFDAYIPWNIGNYTLDSSHVKHASTAYWENDRADCAKHGVYWIPTIYPGFSWDNLTKQKPGSSNIARRGGEFYWEQLHQLATIKQDSVYIGMFDEVDEGTAIFKVTSSPPTQAHFVGYGGLPSDWYLRLTGAGVSMLRGQQPVTDDIPIKPRSADQASPELPPTLHHENHPSHSERAHRSDLALGLGVRHRRSFGHMPQRL